MLKKLMKYDLKIILKFLVWFYAISLGLAGIARLLKIWSDVQIVSILSAVFSSLTYSAIATVFINTFIHILMRFSTSLFKDQSYLTHTLPVKKDTILLSKYLSSLIVILLSVIVSFLSLFIIFYSPEFIQNLKLAISMAVSGFSMPSWLFITLMVMIIFSQICAYISLGFTAIVKGYSYNSKRGARGFAWFVIYYLGCLILTLIVCAVACLISGNIKNMFAQQMTNETFLTVMIVALVCYCLYAVAFYFLCKRELKKGVNVD